MGFSIIPTNLGGVNLNSIASPLAALLSNNNQVSNLTYPSDLGSNPAMGHAVIFQIYDRQTTNLQSTANQTLNNISNSVETLVNSNSLSQGLSNLTAIGSSFSSFVSDVSTNTSLQDVANLVSASTYETTPKQTTLATVSMFMPETLSVNYSSSYDEVSMTEELGVLGIAANAYTDRKNLKGVSAIGIAARVLDKTGSGIGLGSNIGSVIGQAAGVTVNPQMQLLYRGINLREFQLEFILTPKSSAEAQTVKNICDTFTYYSLPDIAGGASGSSGQYLVPPQLFSINFRFLGQNNILGSIGNVISSALTNSGLGFLTSEQVSVDSGTQAKIFTIKTCVLNNVSIDYAPNGWATYNDGYPIQTRLVLSFKEVSMYTKQDMVGSVIAQNYNQTSSQGTSAAAFAAGLNNSAGNASNGDTA
jgi:hypothetical protein